MKISLSLTSIHFNFFDLKKNIESRKNEKLSELQNLHFLKSTFFRNLQFFKISTISISKNIHFLGSKKLNLEKLSEL